MFEWPDLIAYAIFFVIFAVFGVKAARRLRVAAGEPADGTAANASPTRMSDVRTGVRTGAGIFGRLVRAEIIGWAVLILLAIGVFALSQVVHAILGKHHLLLLVALSLPLVIAALYVMVRAELFWIRPFLALSPKRVGTNSR